MLNHSTNLQLDLFCHNSSKQFEVSYVQAFMSLSQDWDFWERCRMCLARFSESKDSPDTLDDPSFPLPHLHDPDYFLALPLLPAPQRHQSLFLMKTTGTF
jgi:hypothetical protein